MPPLPYLSADIPPVRAAYKVRWEDFLVEEVPRIEPEGVGDHVWVEVEKKGLTTEQAVSDVARAVGVRPRTVGYAGIKDARAVARQWLSVEGVERERLLSLEIPRLHVRQALRHPRKLRQGWHRGNRFRILLRDVGTSTGAGDVDAALGIAEEVLAELFRRGVPNYYGPQRFGTRGDTWRIGRALAREQWDRAAGLIAGRPLPPNNPAVDPSGGIHPDRGDVLRARELFEAGRYDEAASAWPRGFSQCARVAEAMARTGGDAARSIRVVGKRMLRLYASAYQSWIFNQVLAERLESIDRVLSGDLAWKHDTDALFLVEDPASEQARASRFEISPTGPLVGRRPRSPESEARAIERRVIERCGLEPGELESPAMRPLKGRRRPLRFRLSEQCVSAGGDADGPFLELRFRLPPGCYATAVLRELGKGGILEREVPADA